MKTQYFVEMTDTYGGEANYSWVNRFLVTSSSFRGAISKVTRETGYRSRIDWNSGDTARYNVPGCCICYFVSDAQGNETEQYSRIKIL